MNRPKIKDFIEKCELPNCTVINIGSLNVVSYQNALNEYIDYLEEQLSNIKVKNEVEHQQNELFCKKVNELDEALDRACEMLSMYDKETAHEDDEVFSKEQWKEWCMKNETIWTPKTNTSSTYK